MRRRTAARRIGSARESARVPTEGAEVQKWEYLAVPLQEAGTLGKKSKGHSPDRLNELGAEGWEAVGLTLKRGDLVAWPVVLLKRSLG
jgi:hypothetical protein